MLVGVMAMGVSTAFAQIKINEVMMNPSANAADQFMANCFDPLAGMEYVEIYNSDKCRTIDLDCYTLAGDFGPANFGSIAFQSGVTIPPLSFIVVGGANVSGADYLVPDFCSTPRFCTSENWQLPDDNGWIALFDESGVAADAIYWTTNIGQAGLINTDPVFDNTPCDIMDCGGPLASARALSTGVGITYAGQVAGVGLTISRALDGTGVWQSNIAPTPGACNAICAPVSDLAVTLDSVKDESCEQSDAFARGLPTGGLAPYDVIWSNGEGTEQIVGVSAGTYTLSITDDEGCFVETMVTLSNFGVSLDVDVIPSDTAIIRGTGALLEVTATNPVSTYSWGPINALSCDDCDLPIARPQQTTLYTVTVEDINGCTEIAQVQIRVLNDENSIFVPTAFTPNADGQNDILFVRSPRVSELEIRIYDRWGREVFYSSDQTRGWDGNDKRGNLLNQGVYAWVVSASFENGVTRIYNGDVALLR